MSCCPYIKQNGLPCARQFRPGFAACAAHRPRGPVREYHPCTSCGEQTRREVDGQALCVRKSCGLADYRRRLAVKRRAATRAEGSASGVTPSPEESQAPLTLAEVAVAELVEAVATGSLPDWVQPTPPLSLSTSPRAAPPALAFLNPEAIADLIQWARELVTPTTVAAVQEPLRLVSAL